VARDAVSYSLFFAVFDITRRVGLRVKAVVTREVDPTIPPAAAMAAAPKDTPTRARVAQAATIVAGGIAAASVAEFAGRPFRHCQRVCALAAAEQARLPPGTTLPPRYAHPIKYAYKRAGMGFFFRSSAHVEHDGRSKVVRALSRVGWRVAAVAPWGLGFLVFAWIGGEV
jgi:hypothetical protein